MATITNDAHIPKLFNEIIRKRVAEYIDGELTPLIRQKVDTIITDVLANLQADSEMFRDMLRHETQLVVRAIYKGEEIKQQSTRDTNHTTKEGKE